MRLILLILLLAILLVAGCGSQTSNAKTEQKNTAQKEEEKVTSPTYILYFQSGQHYEEFKQAVKDEDLDFAFLQQEPQLLCILW